MLHVLSFLQLLFRFVRLFFLSLFGSSYEGVPVACAATGLHLGAVFATCWRCSRSSDSAEVARICHMLGSLSSIHLSPLMDKEPSYAERQQLLEIWQAAYYCGPTAALQLLR